MQRDPIYNPQYIVKTLYEKKVYTKNFECNCTVVFKCSLRLSRRLQGWLFKKSVPAALCVYQEHYKDIKYSLGMGSLTKKIY